MGEQDYSVTTTRFSGDEHGNVAALHIAAAEAAPPFAPVPGTERELPAQLVLLAMGFLAPRAAAAGPARSREGPARQRQGARALHDLGRGRVRRRRRSSRAVADRVGDQRGTPVRAHGRSLPGGPADRSVAPPLPTACAGGWRYRRSRATPTKAPRGRRSMSGPACRRNSLPAAALDWLRGQRSRERTRRVEQQQWLR